jgi:hypothetical protein
MKRKEKELLQDVLEQEKQTAWPPECDYASKLWSSGCWDLMPENKEKYVLMCVGIGGVVIRNVMGHNILPMMYRI